MARPTATVTAPSRSYHSARLCKLFNVKKWKRSTFLTGTAFPFIAFVIFFTIGMVLTSAGASTAVPIGTLIALVLLWCGFVCVCVCLSSREPRDAAPIARHRATPCHSREPRANRARGMKTEAARAVARRV